MSKAVKKSMPFQDALDALEAVVEKIESGEQPLESALADFEHGVALARHCRTALTDIEQKVQVLMDTGELVDLEPTNSPPAEGNRD